MEFLEHEPLAHRTTFGIGGSARYMAIATTIAEIEQAIAFAEAKSVPIVLLGGGSNMLVDDGEADALFLVPKFSHFEIAGTTITIGSGEIWDVVVQRAVDATLYGIENLSGIPGLVGGGVVQNIGAYGAELSTVVQSVAVYDKNKKVATQLSNSECEFGYRDSIFKREEGRYIVTSVTLTLTKGGELTLSYKDLAERFKGEKPSLREIREAVLAIRAGKFPDLKEVGTAGSFFKNPIVSVGEGEVLSQKYPRVPLFPLQDGAGVKVPLAWLLDHVLHMRGFTQGEVQCYKNQPLVLIASRMARAGDVLSLAREITRRVFTECGITIEPEVCVLHENVLMHTLDF